MVTTMHAERYPALQHRMLALPMCSVPEVLALPDEAGGRPIHDSVTAEGR
jgi:hypothetical protein